MRRGLVVAICGCLVAGALILVASGRDWRAIDYAPGHSSGATGQHFVGSLSAWGLVAFAGVVAVAATRGWGRLPVGLALAAGGAAVAALSYDARHKHFVVGFISTVPTSAHPTAHTTVWPYVSVAGGVILAATGVLVALRGPRWSALGARYESPAVRPVTEADVWSALDRGEDPTA